MTSVFDGVFALTEGVPQLDGLICDLDQKKFDGKCDQKGSKMEEKGMRRFIEDVFTSGTRDDLSVVGREGDREDVLGVSDETTGGGAVVQVPQTEGTVPRSREGELTVGGDDEVLDEVVVSGEGLSGDSVLFTSGDVPHHERLVYRDQNYIRNEMGK